MSIRPGSKVPALDVPLVGGGRLRLAEQKPQHFSMVVFYRGYHCPICKTYLRDLDRKLEDFVKRGTAVTAVSTDTEERAQHSKAEWELHNLPIGYGLSIESAREWGLYVSRSIKESEPALFAEPGLFLVRPDGTLYCASIQTMPFARPSFGDVLQAIQFVTEKNYPARGEA